MTDQRDPVTGQPLEPQMPPPQAAVPIPASAPASMRSKLPIIIVLAVIGGFLAVVLYATRNNQSAGDLTIGTCFNAPSGSSVSTVERLACTESHDAEVFHVAEFTGASYPITLTLNSFIDDACVPVLATYVGQADPGYDIGYFYPSRDGWDSGDRTVTCYAVRPDNAKLTQSVKGLPAAS